MEFMKLLKVSKDEGLLFFRSFVTLVKSFTLWSSSGGTNIEFMKLLKVSRMKVFVAIFL